MAVVELIGGPQDGRLRPVTKRLPDYIWVKVDGEGARGTVRFFSAPGAGHDRHFYRLDKARKRNGEWIYTYLWCQNTVVWCPACEVYHRNECEQCTICEGPLHKVGD